MVTDHLCRTLLGVTTKDTEFASGDPWRHAQECADRQLWGHHYPSLCIRHSFLKPMCLSRHWWFPVFTENQAGPSQNLAAEHLLGVESAGMKRDARVHQESPVQTQPGVVCTSCAFPTHLPTFFEISRYFQNILTYIFDLKKNT